MVVGGLVATFTALGISIGAMLGTMATFTGIGLAVAGVAAIIVANWETVKSFFMSIWSAISPAVEDSKTAYSTHSTICKLKQCHFGKNSKQLLSPLSQYSK
ncbi:hypothetical protein ACT7C5_05745 [Bacillus pacificus]